MWVPEVDGAVMNIQWVTVEQLKDPTKLSAGVKDELDKAGVTSADYVEILSTNPFADGSTTIDENRYLPVGGTTLTYEPPDDPSDPYPGATTYNQQNTVSKTSTQEISTQYATTFSSTGNFIVEKLKVSQTFEWTSLASSSTINQTIQSATAIIGGPAYGYTGPTNIYLYWDGIYNSFMYAFNSAESRKP